MPVADSALIIWSVAALATALVIVRPGRVPEYVWALGAAVLLTTCGLIPWRMALSAVAKGGDVYLFLVGMMVLAELARQEGLFDWLARYAVQHAKGSGQRLFDLVFLVGTLVTVFLSNDATAVVLTPAVYAACKAAKAEPLPYLFICAFIANAASFVLPISNPANLVVFGSQMPPLLEWLRQFSLPSLAAIAATYLMLRLTMRKRIRQPLAVAIELRPLSAGARLCALGLMFTGALLLTVSALDVPLGLPTFCAGMATVGLIHLRQRRSPAPLLRHVAWGVLPLVAGLFVLVEAVAHTGVIDRLAHMLATLAQQSPGTASWAAGVISAVAGNLMNNLPTGLIAGSIGQLVELPRQTTAALLIGVDLGPNLSITGSLATLLWLVAIRREGEHVGALGFLRLGVLVMPPALVAALLLLAV
ncbi:arsenic transporter [Pseudomonas sp. GW531-E2]|uniref:arsenic transporter n=1 Tax=unclassified Pseudomonas TaxID=196821 RepID=UPI000C886771|nr:arsenic transporter [Pseudomonas sp. FW305-42]PNA24041.1 arsenic transporter [Pseudomonas sp. MPR-R1B]PNB24695.1 arsenic transporter [Pseudomonas sp. DP16D-E2]PNB42114.1 arsenic transporter [Pseudomonas sp. FW305-17]PNB58810.1 arsenic transporter [Pseudomonas sp. GW531-E2]PNB65658.1 arsenic transporter [Pseudomonas sp. FW305-127]